MFLTIPREGAKCQNVTSCLTLHLSYFYASETKWFIGVQNELVVHNNTSSWLLVSPYGRNQHTCKYIRTKKGWAELWTCWWLFMLYERWKFDLFVAHWWSWWTKVCKNSLSDWTAYGHPCGKKCCGLAAWNCAKARFMKMSRVVGLYSSCEIMFLLDLNFLVLQFGE